MDALAIERHRLPAAMGAAAGQRARARSLPAARRRAGLVLIALFALASMAAMLLGASDARADNASTAERQIKAAFLIKFTEYVEWPESAFAEPDTPIVIGIVGDAGMVADLKAILASQPPADRAIEVHALHEGEPAKGVHLLFIAGATRHAVDNAMAPADQPILLVTESQGALGSGATINFVVTGVHVGFEVSLVDAQRRHLKLGSRLLSVARGILRSAP